MEPDEANFYSVPTVRRILDFLVGRLEKRSNECLLDFFDEIHSSLSSGHLRSVL